MLDSSEIVPIRNYFVDESGDGVLFDRKGHVLLDYPNHSQYFILGLLEVSNPVSLAKALDDLRSQMLV